MPFRRGADDSRRDRRVAHEQQLRVAQRARELLLAHAVGQQHEFVPGRAQRGIHALHFQLPIGADYSGHGAFMLARAATLAPETSIS